MDSQKLHFFRDLVLKERKRSLRIISDIDETWSKSIREDSGDLSVCSIHLADMGTDTQEREKESYILERELRNLKLLDETLKRINDNNFGICIYCGKEISEERLKAVPYATTCIDCQRKEDIRNNRNNNYYQRRVNFR